MSSATSRFLSLADLRHDGINVEGIKTRLDALACAQPSLLRHMGPGIPHLHAVVDGAVMRVLPGLQPARVLSVRR